MVTSYNPEYKIWATRSWKARPTPFWLSNDLSEVDKLNCLCVTIFHRGRRILDEVFSSSQRDRLKFVRLRHVRHSRLRRVYTVAVLLCGSTQDLRGGKMYEYLWSLNTLVPVMLAEYGGKILLANRFAVRCWILGFELLKWHQIWIDKGHNLRMPTKHLRITSLRKRNAYPSSIRGWNHKYDDQGRWHYPKQILLKIQANWNRPSTGFTE